MNIVVVDDDKLVCAALKTILQADPEIRVVGIGHSGEDSISLFQKHTPDILLMDIRMNGMTGLEAGETILQMDKNAKLLFLTTFADDEYIIRSLKIGARGYLLKQNFESIIPAIKAVFIGQSVFGEDIISKIPTLMKQDNCVNLSEFPISEKDFEIIKLVAEGFSNR